jgi:hypothetical protein
MTNEQTPQGLRLGSLIDGKYKVIAKVGRGGMSTVWLAMNIKTNKNWAIKEVRQTGKNGSEIVNQNLTTEIGILKKLQHENLPQIIDIFEKNNTFLIIMDYVEGRTLKAIVDERGAQPQEDVVNWAIQLCSVLDYLHTRKPAIIYRDLKPGNIMLRPDGRIVLIDFGTAREYKTGQEEDTISLGTKGYAAPEQYGGDGQTDARTDIYNLGATIYHLVTGKNPTKPPYEIRPIREWNPSLSTGLEKIILKCIANNPNKRYKTAKELQFALEHYKELETSCVQGKKKANRGFLFTFGCAVLSLVASLGLSVYANSLQSKSYDDQLHLAASMPNEKEQVKAYFEAMKLNPQKVDAYEGLLNNCFLKDGNFSQDEVDKMTKFLGYRSKNGGDTIESQLKKNQEAYDQFAYDMGLAYFYYYGEEGNKQLSQPWFDIAKKSDYLTSAQIERAKRFSQIADYNMRINLKNKAGDNNISYKDYWNDIVLLASGDIVKDDNLKTGLVVYKELVSQILLHANDFKNAGIKKDEVESELEMVELRLVDIVKSKDFDEESDQPIIDEIEQNIAKAKQSIDFAYAD